MTERLFPSQGDKWAQKTTTNNVDSEIWALGSSHLSKLLNYFAQQGVRATSIRGGCLENIERAAELKLAACFIILGGGNDLVRIGSDQLLDKLRGVVVKLAQRRRVSCVLTGTMIPRATDGFVRKNNLVDRHIEQSDLCHHHFVTDIFDDLTRPGHIMYDYFHTDRVHLNAYGLELYKQLLAWVVESYYEGYFTKARTFSTIGGPRTAFWKF